MRSLYLTLLVFLCCLPRPALANNWVEDPYLGPVAGVSTYAYTGGTDLVTGLGVAGGFRYHQRRGPLEGRSRAQGIYYFSSAGGGGYDVRFGSFIGPNRRFWAAETGLDLFYNQLSTPGLSYEPSVGLDWPIDLILGPRNFYALAGITTTWLQNPDRRVDWSTSNETGFGHEFETRAGVGLGLRGISLRLVYSHRIHAWGTSSGIGIGVDYRRKPR